MSAQLLLPIASVFAPLVIATVVAYLLLNSSYLHSRGKR